MKKAFVLVFGFLLLASLALAQGKTPDFSGTWVLDKAKSDPMMGGRGGGGGGQPGMMPDVTLTIEHSGTTLKIKRVTKTEQGDRVQDLAYTTDGKENTNPGGRGGEVKSKSTWDGAKLVTKWTQETPQGSSEVTEVRSLSADGKTLTIETTRVFQGEPRTTKQIFNKQ
jgi:hypothetical protein